ncbi:MAG: hypothetical protein A2096_09155 [Spirochaetes bacterium GWF1_41_5]|nr:MAG: hypothetical protein A2096_09155 [Spirochaetes bacterium GWF1_41_5]HBE03245.1 arylsulfatase [Spirochaetia bacterium]
MSDKSLKPHIFLIITDQQRYDTIRAAGYDYMITPNIDRMAEGGVIFTQAYCPGATCISSRAAIFTGMYPHNTGVYSFYKWNHQKSWMEELRDHGYYLANLGKMHTSPLYGDYYFHERRIVENKSARFRQHNIPEDEWGKFLMHHGLKRPNERHNEYKDWMKRCNALVWEYEERFHSDAFTGDMAASWLSMHEGKDPLFCVIGFPGPHEPYDPPSRFHEMYKDKKIPGPVYREGELEKKPPQHKTHQEHFRATKNEESKIDMGSATDEQIINARRHYFANITLIDEKIGNILRVLEEKKMLENSIVIFTSDHGDNLGDHRLPYKWLMYDSITRIPLIIRDFRKNPEKNISKCHSLVSLMDLGPTILDYAGLKTPSYCEGKSLIQGSASAGYEYVFCEDNYQIMMRSRDFKMVYFIDQPYGELYNLENDPGELENLWDSPACREIKIKMKCDLLDWLAKSNYFNARYKTDQMKNYEMRYPGVPNFRNKLHGVYLQEIAYKDCLNDQKK